MKKIITLLFLSVSLFYNAQMARQKIADDLYAQMAYYDALPVYEDLASAKDPEIKNILRTADCYRLLQDYPNAILWYQQLQGMNALTEESTIDFIQCLKSVEMYDRANQLLQSSSLQTNYPIIVENHKRHKSYVSENKKDSARFSISNLELNSSESDFSPFVFNGDIYFTSGRRNVAVNNKVYAWDNTYFLSLYKGKLKDNDSKNIQILDKDIESKYHEATCVISGDGKTLYITRNNYINKDLGTTTDKVVNLKIYFAQKQSDGTWGDLQNFTFNSDAYSVGHPALTKDGRTMYFVSDMPGGLGETDLYVTHKNENGTWSNPENLGESINTEGHELFPTVFEDGTLFFATDGDAGLGGLDLYMCFPERDPYFEPKNLGYPINTSADDFGVFLNSDIKSGYFASNRSSGQGKDDIYYFTSATPIIPQPSFEGLVLNEVTMEPLANAAVVILDSKGDTIETILTDSEGKFVFRPLPYENYTLTADAEEFNPIQSKFRTNLRDSLDVKQELLLAPVGVFNLLGVVTDRSNNEPIEDVVIKIIDKKTGEIVLSSASDNKGSFQQKLSGITKNDLLSYDVALSKTGYNNLDVSKEILVQGSEIQLQFEMDPLDAIVSEGPSSTPESAEFLAPIIYFDLDKFDIREDAAATLDEFVEQLKKLDGNYTIFIESHTDCRASEAYNELLSQYRANATASYLKRKGIRSKVIETSWKGETQLTNSCECDLIDDKGCSEEQHQLNRRSNISVKPKNGLIIKPEL